MTTPDFRIILGYVGYSEIAAVNELLQGSRASIVEAGRELQDIINALATQREALDGDVHGLVVLLNPDLRGYAPDFIQSLLFDDAGPIPVIGYSVSDVSNQAAIMKKHGATHFVELSKTRSGTQFLALLEASCEQVWTDRQAGKHHLAPDIPAAPVGSIRQQCITVYLPKGGGSSRTTTVTNIGACLASLGNPTLIVDFDPVKGDAHTVLGFTADHTSPLTKGFDLIDRSVFDLILSQAPTWQPGQSVNPADLHPYLYRWEGHRAVGRNLHLLPGLLSPNVGGRAEWTSRKQQVFEISKAILRAAKTMYTFVVVDIGQDYNQPLVAAALDEATDVIIPVPPNRHAVMAVQRALPTVLDKYGNLNKFRWFQAMWLDDVNAPKIKTINDALNIPKLAATIPIDHQVADRAINDCVPYVLWDDGPLGSEMKKLAGNYDPRATELAKRGRRENLIQQARKALIREA